MEKNITPSQYLKAVRKEWAWTENSTWMADMLVSDLTNGRYSKMDMLPLNIPSHIPEKYHARMQQVWCEMFITIMFQRTSKRLSFAERYKLAQNIK